mmetsp:Transcript_17329/g.19723  ORF Transcript_17329/g.19723 Transcript_17329/m.19723 type:complete len:316 (+) Transcript_17329:133-1080(+)
MSEKPKNSLLCFQTKKGTDIYRACTSNEKFEVSLGNVFIKQIVSLVLLGIVIWYCRLEIYFSDRVFPSLFDCDVNASDTYITALGASNLYTDGGVKFCYFKSSMIVLSWALLVPFLLESVSILNVIMISAINSEVLIPISNGEYAGHDATISEVFSSNPVRRTAYSIISLFVAPYRILKIQLENSNKDEKLAIIARLFFRILVFMIPDLLSTGSLFLVSFLVMDSSNSADELVVNLVAVQIFASIDDSFVQMILRPRASVASALRSYSNYSSKEERASYSPVEELQSTYQRHEFGLKDGTGTMKTLHDYEGFHFP